MSTIATQLKERMKVRRGRRMNRKKKKYVDGQRAAQQVTKACSGTGRDYWCAYSKRGQSSMG